MIISQRILLRIRNVSGKSCRENQNTHFYVERRFPESRTFYAVLCESGVGPDRQQMAVRSMRIACWIPEVTHSQNM